MTRALEAWSSGEAYEPYVGRWSRLVAREFVAWLALPPGLRWLDVGCGTGALSEAIVQAAAPAGVLGVDPAEPYLGYARARIADARVRFEVGSASSLPAQSGSVDATVSGLVLNFVTDPAVAVEEMARATRPGGVVACYVWDYADGMQMMRRFWDAAVALDPSAAALDEGRRFPLCHPDSLRALFAAAGLRDVSARGIVVPTVFHDFDDYWQPFLGGQGSAPGYLASVDGAAQSKLRDELAATLPSSADGSIALTARAWAVRGTR